MSWGALLGLVAAVVVGGYLAYHPAVAYAALAGACTAASWYIRRKRAAPDGPDGAGHPLRWLPWWSPMLLAGGVGARVAWLALSPIGRGLMVFAICTGVAITIRFGLRPTEPNSSVKGEGDEEWRQRIEANWPATARAAGLVHPDQPEITAPLTTPPSPHGPGGTLLRVDLDRVLRAPKHVVAAQDTLMERLRADHVTVEPQGIDSALVRAYRGRYPMAVPVSWRALRPVPLGPGEDPPGEWFPLGVTESGQFAVLQWRLSTIFWGVPLSGKSMLIRACLAGMLQQELPHRLWVYDNGADFRPLRNIAHRYAGPDPRKGLELLEELGGVLHARLDAHPDLDEGHELRPTLATPAEILVVGELIGAQDDASRAKVRAETDRLLRRVPREGRKVAVAMLAAAQTPLKDVIGEWRDYVAQAVAARLKDKSLVDPALGDNARALGADVTAIPASLPGVAYLIQSGTGWPVLFRGANVPPQDTRAALIDPYRRLMGPTLRVIDGQATSTATWRSTS